MLEAAAGPIGVMLVREESGVQDRVGRIVEVEAYGGLEDAASHARSGVTRRTAPMFGPPGHAYVYLVYGMHDCLNVVTGPEGEAAAVLIRAVEPISGSGVMRTSSESIQLRRQLLWRSGVRPVGAEVPDARLASGPGRLCAAFGIDRSFSGIDLCSPGSSLRLERSIQSDDRAVIRTPRIGVGYAGEPWVAVAWRLLVAGSPSISGPRAAARLPA